MTAAASKPTLMGHLGMPVVLRVANKGLFGRVTIRIQDFVFAGLWLFQTGALLGRARHTQLALLCRMLGDADKADGLAQFLKDLGKERLAKYGAEPESFFDFFYRTEWREMGVSWPEDHRTVMRLGGRKESLEQLEPKLKMHVLEGIGFGASNPELTARLWKNTWESLDRELWDRARRAGIDVPVEPTPITLGEREQEVLRDVTNYAVQYHPDLVEPLGLRVG